MMEEMRPCKVRCRLSAIILVAAAVTAWTGLAPVGPASRMAHAQVSLEEEAEYTAEDASDEDVYLHTVQSPGETLSSIAEWYTGDPRNWTVLSDFNAGYGSDAVRPNEVILIPKFLLITTTPMPRPFAAPAPQQEGPRLPPRAAPQRPKSKPKPRVKKEADPKPKPSPDPAPETETLELYGPKE
jgi:hypothetical protein